MKSKFFRDAHEWDSSFSPGAPDRVSVCLRLGKPAYDVAISRSLNAGVTSGEYIEALIWRAELFAPAQGAQGQHEAHHGAFHKHGLPVDGKQ